MAFLMPGPWFVAQTFKTEFEIIMQGLRITFSAAFTGYVIAIVIGITVATVMSLSKILERSLYPYAILLQTVPVVAVAPLIVLWFGFEIKSIIRASRASAYNAFAHRDYGIAQFRWISGLT